MLRAVRVCVCAGALVLAAACSSSSTTKTAAPTTTQATPVVREILDSQVDPPGAPGRTLTLVRYTIAPGAQLPAHIHPGVQEASIQSGTLTYTVISGTAEVKRALGGQIEAVAGPKTVTLGPGDAVTETGDMVHFGANKTGAPVVIVASLLTENGRDLAITVPVTSTSVP